MKIQIGEVENVDRDDDDPNAEGWVTVSDSVEDFLDKLNSITDERDFLTATVMGCDYFDKSGMDHTLTKTSMQNLLTKYYFRVVED